MMNRNSWYKTATRRQEARKHRSFSPDEFAIALEQIVAETTPLYYRVAQQHSSCHVPDSPAP